MKPIVGLLLCLALLHPVAAQDTAADPVSSALALFRSGNFEESHKAYAALLPGCTNCGPIHAGVIRSLVRQHKIKEAVSAADSAVASLPNDAAVQTAVGELRFRQGDLDAADRAFVAAANANPPDARAYLGLSRFYEALSKYKTAAKMIERAHQLDSADPEINLEWLYTQPRSARLAALKAFLEKPNNLDPIDREGMEHHINFTEARAKHPDQRCRLVSKVDTAQVEMYPILEDPTHAHGFGLEVKVNDRKARLLLDTGASGITINRKMAEKAGVEIVSDTKVYGIGDTGAVKSSLANAKSIQIGDMQFENCVVDIIERNAMDVDGLIGADVFSNYLVTLDFPEKKLRLSPLPKRPDDAVVNTELASSGSTGEDDSSEDGKPPVFHDRFVAPEMKNYTLAVRFGSHFFLPTQVTNKSNKASGLFLLDTGASSNMLSSEFGAKITKVRKDDDIIVKGLNGKVKQVSTADDAVIQFANMRQQLRDVISIDLSNQSRFFGTEVSGILGFTTLYLLKVEIDYRDGLVHFTYNGN
jgi:predicted aspartyl protease/thioredoxin-like negative regulator of GroEL